MSEGCQKGVRCPNQGVSERLTVDPYAVQARHHLLPLGHGRHNRGIETVPREEDKGLESLGVVGPPNAVALHFRHESCGSSTGYSKTGFDVVDVVEMEEEELLYRGWGWG